MSPVPPPFLHCNGLADCNPSLTSTCQAKKQPARCSAKDSELSEHSGRELADWAGAGRACLPGSPRHRGRARCGQGRCLPHGVAWRGRRGKCVVAGVHCSQKQRAVQTRAVEPDSGRAKHKQSVSITAPVKCSHCLRPRPGRLQNGAMALVAGTRARTTACHLSAMRCRQPGPAQPSAAPYPLTSLGGDVVPTRAPVSVVM
jgi:hypothetical protein